MNIDERLRSSLQTVAREVSVTPEELVHAEHRFVHRREQGAVRRRRSRRRPSPSRWPSCRWTWRASRASG